VCPYVSVGLEHVLMGESWQLLCSGGCAGSASSAVVMCGDDYRKHTCAAVVRLSGVWCLWHMRLHAETACCVYAVRAEALMHEVPYTNCFHALLIRERSLF
jgi:hypothetical protein